MQTLYLIGIIVAFIIHCKNIVEQKEGYDEKFDHEFLSDKVVLCVLIFVSSLMSWIWVIVWALKSKTFKKLFLNFNLD